MPTMINTMTLLVVVLHFLRASVASVPTDDDYRAGSILAIEDICMCLHAIIDRVGAPIHLQSLYTLWSACSKALAILETELFPGCEPSIPSEINMPATPLKLTTLKQQAWAQHRPLIWPAYNGLQRFKAWFGTFYDLQLHQDNLDILNDSLLLLESVADICDTPIRQPVASGQGCTVHQDNILQTP